MFNLKLENLEAIDARRLHAEYSCIHISSIGSQRESVRVVVMVCILLDSFENSVGRVSVGVAVG